MRSVAAAERLRSWFADLGYTPTSTTRHDALQLGHLRVPSSRPLWLERCRKELSAASLNASRSDRHALSSSAYISSGADC